MHCVMQRYRTKTDGHGAEQEGHSNEPDIRFFASCKEKESGFAFAAHTAIGNNSASTCPPSPANRFLLSSCDQRHPSTDIDVGALYRSGKLPSSRHEHLVEAYGWPV